MQTLVVAKDERTAAQYAEKGCSILYGRIENWPDNYGTAKHLYVTEGCMSAWRLVSNTSADNGLTKLAGESANYVWPWLEKGSDSKYFSADTIFWAYHALKATNHSIAFNTDTAMFACVNAGSLEACEVLNSAGVRFNEAAANAALRKVEKSEKGTYELMYSYDKIIADGDREFNANLLGAFANAAASMPTTALQGMVFAPTPQSAGGIVSRPRDVPTPNTWGAVPAPVLASSGNNTEMACSNTSRGPSENPDCVSMNDKVNFHTSRPTGAGTCAGQINGHLTNNSAEILDCGFVFYAGGTVKAGSSAMTTIRPGETQGAMQGLWGCGSDQIKIACFKHQPSSSQCRVNW
jgi:hypothetical protein